MSKNIRMKMTMSVIMNKNMRVIYLDMEGATKEITEKTCWICFDYML